MLHWSGKAPDVRRLQEAVLIDALATPVSITQPDIRLSLDLQGVIRAATLSEALGEQVQSWIGRPWGETVGVGGEQVGRMVAEARHTGVSSFGQVTQRFPSGRQLPIEYTAVRLGESAGLIAVGKNLLAVATLQSRLLASQHAREQEYWKLREVETRYRLLFDASNEAVVLLHADSLRVLEANPTAIRAFGLNPGDDFVHELARSERARFQTMMAQTTAQGRAPGMVVHLGGDGVGWILRSSLMPAEIGPLFLLQLARTADARSPAAVAPAARPVSLDEFAERLPDGLLVIDPDGVVRRANPAVLDMIQANAEGAVIGQSLGAWLRHPGADAAVMLDLIARHRVLRRLSTVLYGAFGTETAVEISAVGNTDIRPAHIGMVLRNVERRPAEAPARPGPDIRAAELGRTPLLTLVRDATYAIEREYIAAALARADGNRSAAADLLGLSRQTLYMKLGRHGFEDDLPTASD